MNSVRDYGTAARRLLTPVFATLLLAGASAQAAPLSFFLDQSNVLPDGSNYLKVTIDDGLNGAINFTVEALEPMLAVATDKFGIQSFAFNLLVSDASDLEISGLPDKWDQIAPAVVDGFGRFDINLFNTGTSRVAPLTFAVSGVDGDTPADYVGLSGGTAKYGNVPFAARVQGVIAEDCSGGPVKGCKEALSAFIGGGSEVPLPASAWLLVTAFAGIAARARRRRTT